MNSLFKRNLLVGYGISLFLLIVSSASSYISIKNLLDSQNWVNHTNIVINKLEQVMSILKDAESRQRGYLLTGESEFVESFNSVLDRAIRTIDEVKTLTRDNPSQEQPIEQLRVVTNRRFERLMALIEKKNRGLPPSLAEMRIGKRYMDDARKLVEQMKDREQSLLVIRTERMNKFASATPFLILVASALSILVTVISFVRVNADFEKRVVLQKELQQKDMETGQRIDIIQNIADQISSGDYKIRVDDEGKDALGSLGISLNKMAASLDESFEKLSQKEWMQTGIAALNDQIIGEKDIETLAQSIINFVTEYSGSQTGAFYLLTEDKALKLIGSYAISRENKKMILQLGEGIAGQCAVSSKMMEITGLLPEDYILSFIAGNVKPKSVIAIPVVFNHSIMGVIEMASLQDYTGHAKTFFETVSVNTGIAINTALSRNRVQELLQETQSQSEELQAQQAELENINDELETQAQKLQSSDEELRVQQEELQQANQELEERSRLLEEKNELILERNLDIQAKVEDLALTTKYKSEFLANMSHELRTPLNSILLLSRLLSENPGGTLSKDQIEYATVIQSSGNGLLTLIDEILDLSKIESGKMQLEYTDVRVEEISNDLISLFVPIAREKGIEFIIDMNEVGSTTIKTDRMRLLQILRNLISNALKFTKKGSVVFRVIKKNADLCFSVKDTGIGIPAEKQVTIFEAFQQADGSTRRQYGGTGLGLSISRELAKLLGGDISVESFEGEGSEFTVTLPLYSDNLPSNNEHLNKPAQEDAGVKQETFSSVAEKAFLTHVIPEPVPDDRFKVSQNDKVILIIEDDTAFARSLLEYTREKGYKGIVAVRGDEGLLLAKQYLPLGILLDVQLPVKSGWEVMDELKSDPSTRTIPVHMMSSHEVKTKSLSKGAVDFIKKPVAFEKLGEMFAKIEEALSRHPKKVLIVEENAKHALALAYFLRSFNVLSEIKSSIGEGIEALSRTEVDCVILDMGIHAQRSYGMLEDIKKTPGWENLPIIVFTGKNLSHNEEMKIKQYADSIVIKTAHSYQRILDEVSLFLHLVEENKKNGKTSRYKKMGEFSEVLKGKTVLVADDDVRNIFSLSRSLESYGMTVVSAVDGKDALIQLETNNKIDLILMDMMMPEMDGYESTKRIRENPRYKQLPIIAVTAKAMLGDREKCINAGASDYITKPVDVDQLISLLRVWLYE